VLQSTPRNEAIHYLAPVAVLIVGITVRKQREEIMFEVGIAFELVIGFAYLITTTLCCIIFSPLAALTK
jgi:hypothetical protein